MAKNISKQIKKSKKEIKDIMQLNLAIIAESMIDQIMKNAKRLPLSQILNSTKDIKPKGINIYKSDLKAALAVISSEALDQARSEVPKARKVKLMENEERLLFGEFEQLPPGIRKRIDSSNQKLIGTQIGDLEKNIFFQFDSSVSSDKPFKEIKFDMDEKAEGYIMGTTISAGSSVVSANMVNEARNAFFFNEEVLEEIEAFEFVNDVPVSDICTDLVTRPFFSKNDPDAFRYTPPLHYNCDSYIRPVIKLKKGQKIEKFKPKTKKLEDTIQFSNQEKS